MSAGSGEEPGPWSAEVGWGAAEQAAAALGDILRGQKLTIAVAESLTGGATAAMLTLAPGASDVLRGAVVAYATDLKASLLDVDAGELAATGPVTSSVAQAMAEGVRLRLGADVGISTTGEAGPDSSSGAPVGTVFIAVADTERAWVRELHLEGGRGQICAASSAGVLRLAAEALSGRSADR